jgi:hypothetical protein
VGWVVGTAMTVLSAFRLVGVVDAAVGCKKNLSPPTLDPIHATSSGDESTTHELKSFRHVSRSMLSHASKLPRLKPHSVKSRSAVRLYPSVCVDRKRRVQAQSQNSRQRHRLC